MAVNNEDAKVDKDNGTDDSKFNISNLPFVLNKGEKILYYAKPDRNIYISNLVNDIKYTLGTILAIVFIIFAVAGFILSDFSLGFTNWIYTLVGVFILFLIIEIIGMHTTKRMAVFGYNNQHYWITDQRAIRQIGITTLVSQPIDITPLDTISDVEVMDLHLMRFFNEGFTVIARPLAFTGYMSSNGLAYSSGQSTIKAFPHMTKDAAEEFKENLDNARKAVNPNLNRDEK